MMNLMNSLVVLLWGFVASESPRLVGGGCLMENHKLIMSGSFIPGTEPKLSDESYRLDLSYTIHLPDDGKVDWSPVLPSDRLPGNLVIKGSKMLFYVLGDSFKLVERRLRRREEDEIENPISHTSFFSESFNYINQISKDDMFPIDSDFKKMFPSEINQNELPSNRILYSTPTPDGIPTPKETQRDNLNPTSSLLKLSNKMISNLILKGYYSLLKDNMRIAVSFNNKVIYLDNLSDPIPIGSPLSTVTLEENQTKLMEYKLTTGDIPLNRAGLSATQNRDHLYITGGNDPNHASEGNLVYQLNLVTYVWERFNPLGFRGAQSGCLYYAHPYLIHAFGLLNHDYVTTTQFIDTRTWSKVQTYDPNPPPLAPNPIATPSSYSSSSSPTTVYIISAIAGFISMLFITLTILIFLRWHRRSRTNLDLPPLLTTPIWSPMPHPQYQLDTNLNSTDPNQFYDFKMVAPIYSSRPITQSNSLVSSTATALN